MATYNKNRVEPLYLRISQPSTEEPLPTAKSILSKPSVTSQFKVSLFLQRETSSQSLDGYLTRCGIFDVNRSTGDSYDFLASEAILPGTNFDMTEQPGSYQGMLEYNATRRIFPDFEVTFYVDSEYNIIRLFEEWMNYANPLYGSDGQYIGSRDGQKSFLDNNSYYRIRYPNQYKRRVAVTKFERNFLENPNYGDFGEYNQQPMLTYELIDAFPKQLTSIPVSYDGSSLTQVTVVFGYTRYITIKHNNQGNNYSDNDDTSG